MRNYQEIDIDYEQFPGADLSLDLHWIQLPAAKYAAQRKVQREAEEKERLAALPEEHKIILPADPTYSPRERDLWPLINETVQRCLEPHPALHDSILDAIRQTIADHRGWRNPFPEPDAPKKQ